jgi:cyclohexanecarboxylate-CoA ligase
MEVSLLSSNGPSRSRHTPSFYRANGYWGHPKLTVYLSMTAAERPASLAVVDPRGPRLSYSELNAAVNRLCNGLRSVGLRKGDVVAVQLPNWVEYCVAHLAATRLGLVTLFLHPGQKARELGFIFDCTSPKAAIIPSDYRGTNYVEMYQGLREDTNGAPIVLVVKPDDGDGLPEGMEAYADFMRRSSESAIAECPVRGSDPEMMLFTSGTSGNPKGILHTYRSANYVLHIWPRLFGLDYRDVAFCPATLGHPAGSLYGLRVAVLTGAPLVLMDRWGAEEAVALIEREGCTHTTLTPTFIEDLLTASNLRKQAFQRMRYSFIGGGRIRSSLVPEFERSADGVLLRGFGMSEHFFSTMMRPYDPLERRTQSDGRCLPGSECAVLDDDGQRVPTGAIGEIAYCGPSLVDGYFTSEAETARTFVGGWQLSGDLARLDPDGYLTVVDRKKDLVIRGGENISPVELEKILLHHPSVAEIAVVGFPDLRLGERVCAVVLPTTGATITLDDLCTFLADRHVDRYKHPERLEIVNDFPRTELGKIRKQEVRQWYSRP